MPYGTIKVDTITFTSGSSDVSIPISGLVQNPTFTGNVTVTGTVSGTVIRGNTVSGATVTGTAGQFAALTGDTAGFTTITGTTVTGTTANFATVSGTTVTGATARFTTTTGVSGVFTSQLSGATITGDIFQGSNITGVSGVFTTRVSGATVTGNAIAGSTITGVSGVFTTVISGASGIIAGNITASAFIPTGSAVPTNGVYLPSANTVGIAANSSGTLFLASGTVSIGTTPNANNPALQIAIAGSKFDTDSQYNQPSGNIWLGMGAAIADKENWFGIRGNYSSSTGAANLLLQPNFRDVGSQAGHYISSSGTGLGAADFDIGKLVTGGSVNTPPVKTSQVKLTAGGNLLVGVTSANANGGVLQLKSGITFPATAVDSSDANTLDDFEEGTWSAAIDSATPGSGRVTTNEGGSSPYIKIGRWVYVYGYVTLSTLGTGGAGNFFIRNLPFQNAGIHSAISIGYFQELNANVTFIAGTVQPNTTEILLRVTTAATNGTTNADFNTYVKQNTQLIFSAMYRIA